MTKITPFNYKLYLTIFVISVFNLSCSNESATEPPGNTEKNSFRFIVNADPQMGQQDTTNSGLKLRNELLEHFVNEVNQENIIKPVDFVIYNGDLVNNANQESFDNFTRIVAKQKPPTLLVHGNHDGHDDDPKFFEAQKKLSGYQKLNYSFELGKWYFVVIGAQQKYKTEKQKKVQLDWLAEELKKANAKNKKVMLFMHYHIMPVGLSQMEFYTYWPIQFKNKILNIITDAGNVKYVFSGHVHTGVKASIKSSLEYKGVTFINCPTPAKPRPFGEEFTEFESKDDRYFRHGFYLDVVVDGENVELFGKKILHEHKVKYPKKFKQFSKSEDIRFFTPESKLEANKGVINNQFLEGFEGWNKSYRYQKDLDNSFYNKVESGKNILKLSEPWGGWSKDEYMETYQMVEIDLKRQNNLVYEFDKPEFSLNGAGGYIKLVFHNEEDPKKYKILFFHWGSKEKKVKTMQKSWFYNLNGRKPKKISKKIDKMISKGSLVSFPLSFDKLESQNLKINLNELVDNFYKDSLKLDRIKVSISHGVWTKISDVENTSFSQLIVDNVELSSVEAPELNKVILNNVAISKTQADSYSPYRGDIKNKR